MPEGGEFNPDYEGFVMRVPDSGAALQFFTEAMRANTETLKQVNGTMQGLQAEQKELLKQVQDTRERVIRIESSTVEHLVAEIKEDVKQLDTRLDSLERGQTISEAQLSVWQWMLKNVGPISSILAFIMLAVFITLRVSGKL